MSNTSKARGIILMYHRISAGISDPWSLCVSPENLNEQFEVLSKAYKPISLRDMVGGGKGAKECSNSVVVTFDDGYADNFSNAAPLLQKHGIPATFYVVSGYINSCHEFWWDELERLILLPEVLPDNPPSFFDIDVKELKNAAVFSEEELHKYRDWKVEENPPTARHSLYYSLWARLRPLGDIERQQVLRSMREWMRAEASARETHRSLTSSELIDLAKIDLFDIGSHTVRHPRLSALSLAEQAEEIDRSKNHLAEMIGRRIFSFAYPYGGYSDYTVESVNLVREMGFTSACTTIPGIVSRSSDLLQLPRIHVHDWDGEQFAEYLFSCFHE